MLQVWWRVWPWRVARAAANRAARAESRAWKGQSHPVISNGIQCHNVLIPMSAHKWLHQVPKARARKMVIKRLKPTVKARTLNFEEAVLFWKGPRFLQRPDKYWTRALTFKHFWLLKSPYHIWSHSSTAQLPPHGLITASGVFRTASVPLKRTEGLNLKVAQHSAPSFVQSLQEPHVFITRLYAKDDGRILCWHDRGHPIPLLTVWSLLSKCGVKKSPVNQKTQDIYFPGNGNYTLISHEQWFHFEVEHKPVSATHWLQVYKACNGRKGKKENGAARFTGIKTFQAWSTIRRCLNFLPSSFYA